VKTSTTVFTITSSTATATPADGAFDLIIFKSPS
jgi:hypothetical protein